MYQLCGTKRYVWIKLCAKVDGFSLIFSLMQKVNGGYWRLNCNEKVLLFYIEMWKCSIFYRKNDKTIEFKSLCPCHSEMTFGCQMTTQARSSRQQRSFFVQNRNHFVGLRFCFCIKKTTSTASGNDWRDETGKIIKIKIFNEASVSAGRFLDALDCLKFLIKFLQMRLEIGRLRKAGEFA